MAFLQGVNDLPAVLVHHTGTMLRFTTGQLQFLPLQDTDCVLLLPDGARVAGRFHRHPANPYVSGRQLVAWIKSWVPYNTPIPVVINQVGGGNQVELAIGTRPTQAMAKTQDEIRTRAAARRLRKLDSTDRRRREYATLERDPSLRAVALAAWGPTCQIEGCATLSRIPGHLRDRLVGRTPAEPRQSGRI